MSQPTLQEALNEEYIEVSKSVPETVRCLEEQSCERAGKCPVSMPNRMRMLFKCSKQGKIKVVYDFGVPPSRIAGIPGVFHSRSVLCAAR